MATTNSYGVLLNASGVLLVDAGPSVVPSLKQMTYIPYTIQTPKTSDSLAAMTLVPN